MLESLVDDTIRILSLPPQRFVKPTVITFVAPPGSGKSYLSKIIAERLHFAILSEERLQTFLNPSPTYFTLKLENILELSTAVITRLLKTGVNVVFDTNLAKKEDRKKLSQAIEAAGGNLILIKIVVDDDLVVDRLNKKNVQVVEGERYGVILNREYYLAEKAKIEEPIGEEYLQYNSNLGSNEIERLIEEIRRQLGPFKVTPSEG